MVAKRVLFFLFFVKLCTGLFNPNVKVVIISQTPFVMQNNEGKFEGVLIDMMNNLKLKYNLTFEYYLVPDGKYGTKSADGLWTGVIGEVVRTNAKIGLGAVTMNSERMEDVHFSVPFYTTGLSAIGKAITFPVVQDNLPKILKMAEDDKITIGVLAAGSSRNFFNTTDREIYKKLYQQMIRCPDCFVNTYNEGIEKVRSSPDSKPYVFFGEKSFFDYIALKSPCDLKVLTCDTLNTLHYALALPKAWAQLPPTEINIVHEINVALTKMLASGTMQQLKQKWAKNECSTTA